MTDRFHYGGQAVIEGVMIRGQKGVVTAVRRPDGGLTLDTQPLAGIYRGRLKKIPLVRGIVALFEAITVGTRTLLYSASVAVEEEGGKLSGWAIWLAVTFSLALAVGLFFLAPLFLTRLLSQYFTSSVVFHLIEGLIRLIIFLLYLRLAALMPDIKRVFAYHGAEHKAVNAYENGAPLEVEAIKKYGTAHRRCGTSFLFVVMVTAILVFTLIGLPALWLMVVARIVLVPVIAGLSYEVIYFGANHADNFLARALSYPGMLLQRLTTREPDVGQIEVALAALERAVALDQPPPPVEETAPDPLLPG